MITESRLKEIEVWLVDNNDGSGELQYLIESHRELSRALEVARELLRDSKSLMEHIVGNPPTTTIKGKIESDAFYILHHPIMMDLDKINQITKGSEV